MRNIVEHIREEIAKAVKRAVCAAMEAGGLPPADIGEIAVETPREKGHGDFSTNAAMQLAKKAGMPPRRIAEIIIKHLPLAENRQEKIRHTDSGCKKGSCFAPSGYIDRVECAGAGFINFHLKDSWLYDALKIIIKEKENYGKSDIGKGQRVMVEFVSANPTGPLHMGNARGGALGDCIAGVLEAAGYDVTREFYINDAGNQIEKFGASLEARYIQLLKGEDAVCFPEDGYHGEDIIEHARSFIAEKGDRLLAAGESERRSALAAYALKKNLEKIKNDLKSYGVEFDVWFSEQSLHDSGEIDETLRILQESGHTRTGEGAVWFKASEFGEEKDEVLIRSNGAPTYFASDIAYHRNKFLLRGFDRVINLLGADHHGHAARMKAAVKALGIDPGRLEIIIFQLVRLYRGGEIARMSKRTGKAISLSDLLDEIGRDAARFFFNTKAAGSHLDFDLDLAVKESDENPVYYVQYAHARICSMLRILKEEGVTVESAEGADLTLLSRAEETGLIRKLADYPEEIRISAQTLEPSRLTRYVLDVASLFHSFYNACRVKGEEEDLMKARLMLVDCTRTVIKNVLDLLKINAPERM